VSSIETYWSKICVACGDTRKWEDLTRQQQDAVIQSVNILLAVLHGRI
jgi:hypothetical protein